MSKIAALKKKATEYEQKKQFDKALTAYQQVLEANESSGEELDVALYNRVGDLLLRTGNVGDAVTYYEKAVDLYAEGGFFNNAIALCNKILRQSPGRTSIYYKLGKISAQKGFKSDAKQNFLEYADRMQKSGETEEAFRALKEFADLSPDQDDIRLMLADQLSKLGKKDEAMEQFQSLLDKYDSEGRKQEANATIERMKAIDPEVDPRPSGQQKQRKSTDLVFLDLTDEPRQSGAVPTIDGPPPAQPETTPEPETSGGSVEGLEVTSFGEGASADAAEYGVNVEPIDLDSPSEPVELELETSEPAEDLDLVSPDESSGDLPLLDTEETSSSQELTFITPDDGDDANSLSSLLTSDEPETPEPGLVDLGSPDETIELDAPAAELDVPAEIAGGRHDRHGGGAGRAAAAAQEYIDPGSLGGRPASQCRNPARRLGLAAQLRGSAARGRRARRRPCGARRSDGGLREGR
jgi:TolA-binding protein